MKINSHPILLSLCVLALLNGCAKDKDPAPVIGGDPIVNPEDDFNLPDERGPDRRENMRMIRAGLRESNEARRHSGLAPLQFDEKLTMIAQRRAREIRNGNRMGNGQWQDPQRMPAGPDGIPGSGRDHDGRDHDGRDGRNDHDDHRDNRRDDHNFPGQPNFGYAAENIISGLRSPDQAYRNFMSSATTRANLQSPLYRRHGVGYFDGTWVEVFAY
jgi:hypothetical protein